MTLTQNLRFVGLLIKMKLSRMMAFRLSFFGAFFADGTLFVIQILTFAVIYGQVDTIGGWGRGQMLIFIGTFAMIDGLNMFIFFFGLGGIATRISDGTLDYYLTKPGNILLRLTFEDVNLGSAPLLLLSGGIIAWGVSALNIHVTPLLLCGYTAMLLLMTLLYYDMELILRTISFFVITAASIGQMEGDMLLLNFKIPGIIYKGFFKVLFCFVLPYGIMATIPTQVLSRSYTLPGVLTGIVIVIVFTAFALWFWRFGLRNYKSASS